jgi:hypothetical protein
MNVTEQGPDPKLVRELERLTEDVDTIHGWWPALADDRIPGTRRRHVAQQDDDITRSFRISCPDCGWPMAWLTATRQPYCTRPHNTAPARGERAMPACTTARALGFSPASVRVDVVDDIAEAATRLNHLARTLREQLGDGPDQPGRDLDALGARVVVQDVGPHRVHRGHHTIWVPSDPQRWKHTEDPERPIDWLRTKDHVVVVDDRRLVGGYSPDPEIVAVIGYLRTAVSRISDLEQARAVRNALTPIIGLVRHAAAAGRRAARVPRPCPICERMTLVVLEAVYDPDTGHARADLPTQRRHVLCTSTSCRCEKDDCDCQRGRPHRWTEDEWERLGLIITTVDEEVRTTA